MSNHLYFPADKSLFHRAAIFSALIKESKVLARYIGRDNLASVRVVNQLGVGVKLGCSPDVFKMVGDEKLDTFSSLKSREDTEVLFTGGGIENLSKPSNTLNCGNSGTTSRMIMGLLSSCPFESTLDGDSSLRRRPFARVVNPLTELGGAAFSSDMLPITVIGEQLKNDIIFHSSVSSAQVKSCLLLSAIASGVGAVITEPSLSRDHTERLLTTLGYSVTTTIDNDGKVTVVYDPSVSHPVENFIWRVPGDLSSAAFFLVLGSVREGLEITCKEVLFNESRSGVLDVLKKMGADFEITPSSRELIDSEVLPEVSADISLKASHLKAVKIDGSATVRAIDEIPILCVAALFSEGITQVRDAVELRVKESDRISMMKMLIEDVGGEVNEYQDGLDIVGVSDRSILTPISESVIKSVESSGDHRIIMSAVILNFIITGKIIKINPHEVETSFPNFYSNLELVT